ncbi:hypothetical protein ACN27G_30975 [Plantactinospora sp. WMMB334]|uniref:hypothetical protein n=1 Tax=Plantactinospora sp. WMMB334 TaxID=3404119 RepID=UPI003B937E17
MALSLRRRRATVAVAALVAGTPPLLSGVAVAAPGAPSPATAVAPARIFPAGSVGRIEVGSVPHGPDVADPRSAEAPHRVAPGSYPPPPDRPGGGSAILVRPAQPSRPTGPGPLLALVATVCVVGVSAGAIRAIFAQRTTQTVVA